MVTYFLKRVLNLAGIFLWASFALGGLFAQNSTQERMEMIQLAEGVYTMVHPQGSSNSTFVITDEGVLVFDMHIRTADQTMVAIRNLTDQKVVYLVSSHAAGDHSSGGWHFQQDQPLYIATKDQVRDLFHYEARGFERRKASSDPRFALYKGKQFIQPDIGFDGSLTIYLGGLTFQLRAEGYGHTSGDLTVYIPQRRVMLMGDLLNTELHPGQGETAGVFFSKVQGWIEVLDRIIQRNLPVETYVPGHGPVHLGRGVADLEEQRRYFVLMRREVARMIQEGKSLAQIQDEIQVPSEFSHYTRPGRLRNILRLFYDQVIERGH